MPSAEDYESDYDARPEAGRPKRSLDSDESDSERPSSGPKRRPPFDDDGDDDDDDDDLPIVLELEQPASAAVNPIRQPSAFAPPSSAGDSSSGPTFFLNSNKHNNNNSTISKTPIHAAVSADGTSMFCVEGYVNTPELSAGRGGGLSQGLPANGPYKSLFRARSESRASNKASATATAAPVAPAPDAALYVLAEAAQSPDALSSRVSTASPAPARSQAEAPAPAPAPAPAHTSRNHRKPSPPAASSSPASSVTPFDPFSAARPSSAVSANASPSHIVVVEPGPPQRPVRGQSRGGGTTGMESTHRERRPVAQVAAQPDRSGIDRVEPRHDERRHSLPPPRQSAPSAAERREAGSVARARPRNAQRNGAGSKDVASVSPQRPSVDDGGYDHAGDHSPSYYETEPSYARNAAAHTARGSGQSLSPPPPKTSGSPTPSLPAVNQHPASARTTSNDTSPALVGHSCSLTPGRKLRMITLLIEDRRHGTDELAEVHVPLKTAGEGYVWADAMDVCAALQSGPSRIDGPAKVFTMRGKYRQIFLRVSADGEETTQSANLQVETNKTLSIVVEGISDPRLLMPSSFFSPSTSTLATPGPATPVLNKAHPIAPLSINLDLDGIHTTSGHKEVDPWSGRTRKRKREASLGHIQRSPLDSPESHNFTSVTDASAATRPTPTPPEHYARPWKSKRADPISNPDCGGYMSDSPPTPHRRLRAQRRDPIASTSTPSSHHTGYETDQPFSSVPLRLSSGKMTAQEQYQGSDRELSLLLQPPPTPSGDPQHIHDRLVSYLRDHFTEDAVHWDEFARSCAHVGFLSNVALLRVYWFAQGRLDTWVGSRLPKHLEHKKVEIRHVLEALGVTEDWYRECNETLSLAIAYGERGERYEDPRAVAASRDRAPKSLEDSSERPGPPDLLVLLRQVHDDYCERVRGRASGKVEKAVDM